MEIMKALGFNTDPAIKLKDVHYDKYNNIVKRVIDQAAFAVKKDIGTYPTNNLGGVLEKIGNAILYVTVDVLPGKIFEGIKNFVTDPRVVTVALTALGMIAVSAACYPLVTAATLAKVIPAIVMPVIRQITLDRVRLVVWAWGVSTVAGYGLGRALGRFCNTPLYNHLMKSVGLSSKEKDEYAAQKKIEAAAEETARKEEESRVVIPADEAA